MALQEMVGGLARILLLNKEGKGNAAPTDAEGKAAVQDLLKASMEMWSGRAAVAT